jgi:hypothetical protein
MGLYEGRGQLTKAMKTLMLRWNDTKGSWEDVRSEDFENTYLQPLEMDLRNTVAAMDHMAIILHQIRRDCQ